MKLKFGHFSFSDQVNSLKFVKKFEKKLIEQKFFQLGGIHLKMRVARLLNFLNHTVYSIALADTQIRIIKL